tara:strand:+ start:3850 stop:4002 length:153 start_codon:yes stop_codon:yes gene_type:complete
MYEFEKLIEHKEQTETIIQKNKTIIDKQEKEIQELKQNKKELDNEYTTLL